MDPRRDLQHLAALRRIRRAEDGGYELEYTAIDPAVRLFSCSCGKAECIIAALRDMREHIAALLRAIIGCGIEKVLPESEGAETWPSVTYPLHMAVSIEDVYADPSFVDDSGSAFYCQPAWDADEADRESASKYVAALVTFNFIWSAYEAVIDRSARGLYPSDKVAVRARKIFMANPHLTFAEIPKLLRIARHFCQMDVALKTDIEASAAKFGTVATGAASDLARIFRNHIVHGDDAERFQSGAWAVYRFYAVGRLLLVLIQALVRRSLTDEDAPIVLSLSSGEETERAGWLMSHLHLRPERWRGKDPRAGVRRKMQHE